MSSSENSSRGTTLYSDSRYPVRDSISRLHDREWDDLAGCGTWWNAEQRLMLAAEARATWRRAGMEDGPADDLETRTAELPDAARAVAQAIAMGGTRVDRAFYKRARVQGLREEEYVETVGIVARLANLDLFARGIGVPSRPLPKPRDDTEPARVRPTAAIDEGAFTHSIPAGRRGGAEGADLYGDGYPVANILRSLSLVPLEAMGLIRVLAEQYMPDGQYENYALSSQPELSRSQVELIAARVSALNECFY